MACNYLYNGVEYTKEELINKINSNNIESVKPIEISKEGLYRYFNIEQDVPFDDFIDRTFSSMYDNVKSINPELSIINDENRPSSYDRATNTVNISLYEIALYSQLFNVTPQEYLKYVVEHEMLHAIQIPAILQNENLKNDLTKILDKLRQLHSKKPYIDYMRMDSENPRALDDIYEMVSEMYSNPYFNTYLKSIGNKKETLWNKIINFFRNILGLPNINSNSLFDKLDNLMNVNKISQDAKDNLQIEDSIYNYLPPQGLMNEYYKGFTSAISNNKPVFEKTFDELIVKLGKIERELDSQHSGTEKKYIRNIIEEYSNITVSNDKIESGFRLLESLNNITDNIEKSFVNVSNSNLTDSEKLVKLFSFVNEVNSFEELLPFIQEISNNLSTVENSNKYAMEYNNKLKKIINITQNIKLRYLQTVRPILVNELGVEFDKMEAATTLKKEIDELDKRISSITDTTQKTILTNKKLKLEQKLLLLPTKENFEKLFNGEVLDVSFVDLHLVSMGLNNHFTIQRLSQLINDKEIALTSRTLEVKNKVASLFTKLKSKISNISHKKINDTITQDVTIVTGYKENDKGDLEEITITTKSWNIDFTPEYIYEYSKRQSLLDYYKYRKNESVVLNDKYEKELLEFKKWKKKYSETKYESKYYDQFEILDEELIKDDGTKTTLRKEKNELYKELDNISVQKMEFMLSDDQMELINEKYAILQSELKDLLNPYDNETFLPKTGFALKLQQQAVKHRDSKKDFIEYIIDASSYEQQKKDQEILKNNRDVGIRTIELKKEILLDKLNKGLINKVRYDKVINSYNQQIENYNNNYKRELYKTIDVVISPEYYERHKVLRDEVNSMLQDLLANPEIAKYVTNLDDVPSYEMLIKTSAKYRDSDGVINGNIISDTVIKNMKEHEEKIKLLQETVVQLQKLGKYTKAERKRVDEINNNPSRTIEDLAELAELKNSLKERQKVYLKYKDDIDEYSSKLKELYSLSTRSYTEYYYEKLDSLTKIIKQDTVKEIDEMIDIEDYLVSIGYVKDGVLFYDYKGELIGDLGITIDHAANEVANEKVKTSEWYKNNHTSTTKEENGVTHTIYEPIYVWRESIPNDPSYIIEEPSFKYKTHINKAKENKDYRLIAPKIPSPKKGTVYHKTDNVSFEFKEYRDGLREINNLTETESGMSGNQKMYDILPGVPKHSSELTKDFGNKLLTSEYYKTLGTNLFVRGTDSEQFMQEGTQSKQYSKRKMIPFRYNRFINKDSQTEDLLYSTISYYQQNSHARDMISLQPIFEAMLFTTEDLETLKKAKTSSAKTFFKTIKSWAKTDGTPTNTEVKDGESNLHKNIQHLLDTYIYGETKSSGMIGNVDTHKVVSSAKSIMSKSIFMFNWFTAVKTTIAGKVNFLVNAQQGKGFFSREDAIKGTAMSSKQIPQILNDYKGLKFGNKSHIGQSIEFFNVLQGGMEDAYGRYTSFNVLNEAGQYLTLPKHLAEIELQISAFNAISIANSVKLKDGTKVPFHEAFETVNGKYQVKNGATKLDGSPIEQEDINRITYRVKMNNLMINGAFRSDEKAKIEKNPLGSLLFYLNGFVIPGIVNRFGTSSYSYMSDDIRTGHFRETLHFMKQILIYRGQVKFLWNELDENQKNRVVRFMSEMSAAILFALMGMMLGSDKPTEELKRKSDLELWTLSLVMASASEIQTFIPVPYLGGDEIIRKIANPFAVERQATDLYKILLHTLELGAYPFDETSGRYKRDTGVNDGFHDKGDAKVIADIVKLLGLSSSRYTAIDKVKQIKAFQTIR